MWIYRRWCIHIFVLWHDEAVGEKLYASPDLDKRILGDVVDIFTNSIDMADTETNEDLLGRTYEYCIAQFAEKEGASGGEFYTPSSIVKTRIRIIFLHQDVMLELKSR